MSRHAALELAAEHRMLGQDFGKDMHGPALPFGCRRERDRSLATDACGVRATAGDRAQPFRPNLVPVRLHKSTAEKVT